MNFTLEKKFNLALIGVGIQLLLWINNNVYFFLNFSYGDLFVSIFRIVDALSVLLLLPFFITLLRNRSLIFNQQLEEKSNKTPPQKISLTSHIATRIGSILLIFGFSYAVILKAVDPGGYGIIFAGIATVVIVFIALIIDSILIYKKEKDSSRFYTNIFIISAFILGAFSIFGAL